MIKGVNRPLLERALYKANSLLLRYGDGVLPKYSVEPVSLLHWLGYSTTRLDTNIQGIELVVHKSKDVGLVMEYNPRHEDIDYAIIYGIALVELGFVEWDIPMKEYSWGNPMLTDAQKMAATLFVDEVLNNCAIEEVVDV